MIVAWLFAVFWWLMSMAGLMLEWSPHIRASCLVLTHVYIATMLIIKEQSK